VILDVAGTIYIGVSAHSEGKVSITNDIFTTGNIVIGTNDGNGVLHLGNDATLKIIGEVSISVGAKVTGSYRLDDDGSGTQIIRNSDALAPRNSPGLVAFAGDYIQEVDGVL